MDHLYMYPEPFFSDPVIGLKKLLAYSSIELQFLNITLCLHVYRRRVSLYSDWSHTCNHPETPHIAVPSLDFALCRRGWKTHCPTLTCWWREQDAGGSMLINLIACKYCGSRVVWRGKIREVFICSKFMCHTYIPEYTHIYQSIYKSKVWNTKCWPNLGEGVDLYYDCTKNIDTRSICRQNSWGELIFSCGISSLSSSSDNGYQLIKMSLATFSWKPWSLQIIYTL